MIPGQSTVTGGGLPLVTEPCAGATNLAIPTAEWLAGAV